MTDLSEGPDQIAELPAAFETAVEATAAPLAIYTTADARFHANPAYAEMFGLPHSGSLRYTAIEELSRRWLLWDEAGAPLPLDETPSRRILLGKAHTRQQRVIRCVERLARQELWINHVATPIFDREGGLAMVVSNFEDITELKRAELRTGLLARAGKVISAARCPDRNLDELARIAIPGLADWCTASVPVQDGRLRVVAIAHSDPEKVAFAREYAERYAESLEDESALQIMRDGPSVLIKVTDETLEKRITDPAQLAMLREVGMRWLIRVPICADEERLGILSLINAESQRQFDNDDLDVAEELGRRAGEAIKSARMRQTQAEIATVLQQSLMPHTLPEMRGYASDAFYKPAADEALIGGDFYDAFHTPTGWVLLVGDVAGHGVKAATLTAQARHVFRSIAMFSGDLERAVRHLNRVLCAEAELSLCSLCAMLLPDAPDRLPAKLICAGHPRPILVKRSTTQEVGEFGPMVGAFRDSEFFASEIFLSPSDMLVLYTDGLVDARGAADRLGVFRLRDALRPAASPGDAVTRIQRLLNDFERGPQADDTAVVALMRNPVPGGAAAPAGIFNVAAEPGVAG